MVAVDRIENLGGACDICRADASTLFRIRSVDIKEGGSIERSVDAVSDLCTVCAIDLATELLRKLRPAIEVSRERTAGRVLGVETRGVRS